MLDKPKFFVKVKPIIIIFTVIITTNVSHAQTRIDTDRPDQTESAFTIPLKFIQVEAGFVVEKANDVFKNYTSPTVLTKYGLCKKLELRLITEYGFDNNKIFSTGFQRQSMPLQLGMKVALLEEKGLLPKTSLIAHSSLLSTTQDGKDGTKHNLGLNYRFTFQNTISKKISLGYNLGMEIDDFNEKPIYIYTLTTGFEIGKKWYAYVESFGSIIQNEAPQNSLDGGFAYYVNNNFKLDISAGIGISNAAPRNYVAVGFSFRFDTDK